MSKQEHQSEATKAILARTRKLYDFDLGEYLRVPSLPVKVRVPTKREQEIAQAQAKAYVEKLCKDAPSLAADVDFVEDAKCAFIVATAFRSHEAPELLPAWPTGELVSERFTTDEIGVLVRLLNEVRSKDGPVPDEISDEKVEAYVTIATLGAGSDVPNQVLAALPHYYLSQLFVAACLKLEQARRVSIASVGASEEESGP